MDDSQRQTLLAKRDQSWNALAQKFVVENHGDFDQSGTNSNLKRTMTAMLADCSIDQANNATRLQPSHGFSPLTLIIPHH
jgi:hypothetical protein